VKKTAYGGKDPEQFWRKVLAKGSGMIRTKEAARKEQCSSLALALRAWGGGIIGGWGSGSSSVETCVFESGNIGDHLLEFLQNDDGGNSTEGPTFSSERPLTTSKGLVQE